MSKSTNKEENRAESVPEVPDLEPTLGSAPTGEQEPGATKPKTSMRATAKPKRRSTVLPNRFKSLFPQDIARMNVADARERITFIGVLVGVSVFIFIGKAFLGLPAWIGLVVSAAGVFGYGILAWLDRNNRVRMDKAGDNCYYLGLTFTLTSLAAVLYRIDFDVSVAEYIISGFGIAIGSTIFGIIARLVLIQFVEELDDIEQKARTRLTESADQLRVDLEDATSRFQGFMISLQDEVKVSIVSMTSEQVKQQRELVGAVESALKDAIGTMEQSSNKLADTLGDHSKVIADFNAASKRSAKAADNLAEKVSSIELPYDQLEEGVGKVVSEIDKIREGLSDLPLLAAAEKMDEYARSTHEMHTKVSELTSTTGRMVEQLEKISTSFEKTADQSGAASDTLRETVKELQEGLNSFQKVASDYVDGMTDVAETLAEKVDV
ncbi:hypothetical protein NHF40_01165 [Maricaulaceae bacterium EIL42A08]|nr:hypothetical protein [Maricaulaceae bacterium EIL42A08]